MWKNIVDKKNYDKIIISIFYNYDAIVITIIGNITDSVS